jgi:phenylalanyl-tRNA synthetase alpha chain
MLRDLEQTLTNEAANALRDRIYLAIHQGTEHQWASAGRPAVTSDAP